MENFFDAHFVFIWFKKLHSQHCSILLGLGQSPSHMCAFYCRVDLAMVTRRDGTLKPKVEHVELLATQAVLEIETILLENNNVRKLASVSQISISKFHQ